MIQGYRENRDGENRETGKVAAVVKRVLGFYRRLDIQKRRGAMSKCHEGLARSQAIQEIEYLRRRYARATDMIGEATDEAVRKGREIYRRVFAESAVLNAGEDLEGLIGPDAWADVVLDVLGPLGPTQHLIGTQLVDDLELTLDDECLPVSGSACMESYVQAWHERTEEEKVWLYLGIYIDKVRFTPGVGWQIYQMDLRQLAGETRYMDAAVGYRD